MSWDTIWTIATYVAVYAIGRGIGRASGLSVAAAKDTPLHFQVIIDGDPVGGFGITDFMPIPRPGEHSTMWTKTDPPKEP